MAKLAPLEERFDSRYKVCDDGCWEWTGARSGEGYGAFVLGSLTDGTRRIILAHRWNYMRHKGPIPDGLQIDHLCRNPLCVNPDHMEAVTIKTNVLRGIGITAMNARKTHCKRGHPLSGENLYITPDGARQCKECRRMRGRKYSQTDKRKEQNRLQQRTAKSQETRRLWKERNRERILTRDREYAKERYYRKKKEREGLSE